ncbi:hypothetical protein CERZMDRAFT_97652 [Cercospora zeae-maydis SCOH1-5]|uniref:AA1-like domain-containing protein n=1 Tax=Cercospora zeae-maydis SCOH1-5 TaxID=717836 RepID=A0A6A6FG27_9PEZI|nr:hypothetical protein CERZMDRAFT_97652 [Cercospora zeae-maydis SCOH1-5]
MLLSTAALLLVPLSLAMQPFDNKLAATRRLSIHLTNNTTGDCSVHVEDSPWAITDVTSFQAHPGSSNVSSYFAFNFEDINDGLELKTDCSFALPLGSNVSVADDKYHLCTGGDVRFKYSGQLLQVSRWYQDSCLGPPPYDSAIAHGRANVNLTKTQAADGVLATQIKVQMPISSLS